MSEHAGPPPEGALITAALKRQRLSARAAALKAGISETRWRQITSGYQTVSGQRVPVRAPADTLARMAQVAGATPEQLIEAGRQDAAGELRSLPVAAEPAAEPSLSEVIDRMTALAEEVKELRQRDEERERQIAEEIERLRGQQSG